MRQRRREELVQAALRLFSAKPYADIKIKELTAEAGVAYGLLFYHFKDKRGLWLEPCDVRRPKHLTFSDRGASRVSSAAYVA